MPGWFLTERQLELWATEVLPVAHLQRRCRNAYLVACDIVDDTLIQASKALRVMAGRALVIDEGVAVTV